MNLPPHGNANGRRSPRSTGFTILELLVTLAIIGLLIALILPALHSARESARDLQCRNNLKQIGLALHSYHEIHRRLPSGWRRDAEHRTAFGWASQILPQLEQTSLASVIDFDRAVDATTNQTPRTTVIQGFLCPSDYVVPMFTMFQEKHDVQHDHPALSTRAIAEPTPLTELPASNYVGVFGTSDPDVSPYQAGDGVFVQDHSFRFPDLRRGQTNTVMVGERTARKLPATWFGIVMDGEDAVARVSGFADLGPNRRDADECEFDSRHFAHVNFLYADGHVSPVHDTIDRFVYRRLATRCE